MECQLIGQYPEIGDDAVTLTENDAGGSISMTMIFELHAVAFDDEYNFSRYFSILKIVLINNILHLQHIHITFSILRPMILSLVGMILPRFCTNNSITFVSLSLFWVIFIHFSQLWTNN